MKIIENENDSFNISLTVVDTWQWREKLSTKQLGIFRDLSNWGTEGKTENFYLSGCQSSCQAFSLCRMATIFFHLQTAKLDYRKLKFLLLSDLAAFTTVDVYCFQFQTNTDNKYFYYFLKKFQHNAIAARKEWSVIKKKPKSWNYTCCKYVKINRGNNESCILKNIYLKKK